MDPPARAFVDLGDLLFGRKRKAGSPEPAAKLLVEDLKQLQAQALVPGELDLRSGLTSYVERMKGLRVLAGNLRDKDGGQPFEGTVEIERGGVKALVVGVVEPALFKEVADIRVLDPIPVLKEAVASQRRGDAMATIVLAHARSATMKAWLQEVEGVTLALVGHERRMGRRAERVGKTWILGGGDRGRHLGRIDIHMGTGAAAVLEDGGAVRVVEDQIARVDRRLSYYRGHLKRTQKERSAGTKKGPSQDDFFTQRLAAIAAERETLEAKRVELLARPQPAHRFVYRLQSLDREVPDDPETAQRVRAVIKKNKATHPTSQPTAGSKLQGGPGAPPTPAKGAAVGNPSGNLLPPKK